MFQLTTPGQARRTWRAHEQSRAAATLSVGLAGTFTVEPLLPLLGAALLREGWAPAFRVAPFNQLLQVCLDPSLFEGCDVIVLAWRMEDLMGEELEAFLNGQEGAWQSCLEKTALLTRAMASLRERFSKSIIVNTPPLPMTLPVGALELSHAAGLGAAHRGVLAAFLEGLRPLAGIALWDMEAAQHRFGAASACDFRHWYLYRQPFSDPFLLEAGVLLARSIRAQRRAPRKCIVLDGDNTLWGGIIGEEGTSGVQIGGEFPGSAFRDFQRLLQHWRAQGVLLALASKNNEADVWELFERHSGMLLRRSDFACWRIDWNSKPENLVQIARELNLGLESLVFVDDNAFEVEAVRQALPEVLCVHLPEDPAEIVPTLRELTCFDRLSVTDEDRQRTEMILAERQRQELGARLSKAEFLQSIGLQVRFSEAQETDLERVAQLINKTNQFNLTTRRRTPDEVRALSRSPAHRLYAVQVADRFGTYGLTGVVIAERQPGAWVLDTFLLSCRVLGRGVETAILSALAAAALADGVAELAAAFVPSAKNAPAASFLPDHGFQQREDGSWAVEISKVPSVSPSVVLTVA